MNEVEDNEPIGKLDGQVDIERVIVQDEVKLWRSHAVLSYLDGPVYDFDGALVEIVNPVPVFSDDMKRIGFATASIEYLGHDPHRIVADLILDYATEERFLTEMNIKPLYPRIFGRLALPAMPLFDFRSPIKISKLVLQGIQISHNPPADPRLNKLVGEKG